MNTKLEDNKNLINLVLNILKEYSLCEECLGRQFALLDFGLTNKERGKSIIHTLIMQLNFELLNNIKTQNEVGIRECIDNLKILYENANCLEIKDILVKVFENEPNINIRIDFLNESKQFECYLCNNLFLNIDKIVNELNLKLKDYEFENFLLGTSLYSIIQEREDEFRVKFNIITGESIKKNLNRVIGIKLSKIWNKLAEFNNPNINIIINIDKNKISYHIQCNPIFIYGRYKKLIRGIPQTHWPHRICRGKGCEQCNFTGKQYETSVEQLISPFIMEIAGGISSVFHSSGREDIDARCLGNGRPFIIEVKQPRKRFFDLKQLENKINSSIGDKVIVSDFQFVNKKDVINLKSIGEKSKKTYLVLVESENEIDSNTFNNLLKKTQEILLESIIYQQTPTRVLHRRANKTREKRVFDISGIWLDNKHFKFQITAIGGTYIKELVSGDEGRTNPSISEIFQHKLKVLELDVLEVNYI